MKKLFAVCMSLLLLLAAACSSGGGASFSYEEKDLLEYAVQYGNEEFSFPRAKWGSSQEEVLQALGLTKEDVHYTEPNTFLLKQKLVFDEPSCAAVVKFQFVLDGLAVMEFLIGDDASIPEDTHSYISSDTEEVWLYLQEKTEVFPAPDILDSPNGMIWGAKESANTPSLQMQKMDSYILIRLIHNIE